MTVQTGAPQDRGAAIPLRVVRVGAGQTLFVWTISTTYGGCFTHFKDKRSAYCPDDHSCPWKSCQREQIWKGYGAVCWWDKESSRWIPAVLEISERLEHDLRDRWERGQVWCLNRPPETANKRKAVSGRLSEMCVEPANLPQEFDIRPVLCNIFRRADVQLGKANPMPLPQTMLPFEAAPPAALRPKSERPASAEEWQKLRQSAPWLQGRVNGQTNGD